MKTSIQAVMLFITVISIVSCGPTLKVTSDYDKNVSFQNFKTFAIYKNDTIKHAISELNQDRIINSVKAEFTKKGYAENASPDLWVNTTAILKDQKSVTANTNYYGYGGYYRPYMYGGGMGGSSTTSYDVQNYKDGSIIIDVIDSKTKKLVWQGIGNKEIDKPSSNPDVAIAEAITKIMASFPNSGAAMPAK
jgi:hypothetical protein